MASSFAPAAKPETKADPGPTPSLAVHLANRMAYGPCPGDVERIESLGFDDYLGEQLASHLPDPALDAALAQIATDTYNETLPQLWDRRNATYNETMKPFWQARDATWVRIINSKRQLFERTVEFWHNHFNVYGPDWPMRSLWTDWDKLIRRNAYGNFRAMLEETAKHPCMLYYLDNYLSTDAGPNENYSRELFELHTLGINSYLKPGGYVDEDVYEASRCFTGWTFETANTGTGRGQFKYVNDDHDRFTKYVLGQRIVHDQPALKDGRDVLDLIAYHPGTAYNIARKLCIRFVSDTPSETLISRVANAFMIHKNHESQIMLTLGELFHSDEFKNSRMTKFKRPIEWVASLMRALEMPYVANSTFGYLYEGLGMPMWQYRAPDGYADDRLSWAHSNGLLQRWNWIFRIASGWYTSSGIRFDASATPAWAETPEQIAKFWSDRVCGRELGAASRNAMRGFVAEGRNWNLAMPGDEIEDKRVYAAVLAAMSPEFMRR